MTIHTLIGLTGRKRAGKDTAASILNAITAGYSHRLAFADPIREMLAAIGPYIKLSPTAIRNPTDREAPLPVIGASYRKLAQTLGTEWGRHQIDPLLWINIMGYRLTDVAEYEDAWTLIITDVRMPNEAEFIRARGGEVWHIDRDNGLPPDPHTSEAGLPAHLIDRRIDNNGTLDQLREQLNYALRAAVAAKGAGE